jgi:undecaprenyl diphosphate synthase
MASNLELKIPNHVAIIMDGNGRWAASRGLPRTEGHRHGTENLRRILRSSAKMGIPYPDDLRPSLRKTGNARPKK